MAKTNGEVIAAWNQGKAARGGNVRSVEHALGCTLYSYATPIAHRAPDGTLYVTVNTYSVTTSGKHMPDIRGARPAVEHDLHPHRMDLERLERNAVALETIAREAVEARGARLYRVEPGFYRCAGSFDDNYDQTVYVKRSPAGSWDVMRLHPDGVQLLFYARTLTYARRRLMQEGLVPVGPWDVWNALRRAPHKLMA